MKKKYLDLIDTMNNVSKPINNNEKINTLAIGKYALENLFGATFDDLKESNMALPTSEKGLYIIVSEKEKNTYLYVIIPEELDE